VSAPASDRKKPSTLKSKLEDLQQKARERTVKTQNVEYDLETLVKKINAGVIRLDPGYQRRHRWTEEVSSGLIESLILNIPIPLIYISQDVDVDEEVGSEQARYSVIDGQQRLTAISRFFRNEFKLVGLHVLDDLNGSRYADLPPFLTRRLEERTLRCLRIDSTVDAQVKYDIFERLNSGSVKLEPQELRNAVSRGAFNDMIKRLAKDKSFRTLLQISKKDPDSNTKVKKMEDVELVLRFFALYDGNYKSMKKGFKQFLSDEMDRFNKLDASRLLGMETAFTETMRSIVERFGPRAFAKYRLLPDEKLKRMSKFNAAVYDALAVSIHDKVIAGGGEFPEAIDDKFRGLFKSADFFSSVEGSVNDFGKIDTRIKMASAILG
jgi:hypothetical protein